MECPLIRTLMSDDLKFLKRNINTIVRESIYKNSCINILNLRITTK